MVMASVMSKVGPFYSFSRWLLTSFAGLVRYMHPSDQELRLLANVPKDKGKKGTPPPLPGASWLAPAPPR